MIYSAPGATFTAIVSDYATGLTGTLGVRIRDASETDVVARHTTGIVEGVDPDFPTVITYTATLTAPASSAVYEVMWDDSFGNIASEALVVNYAAAPAGPGYAGLDDVVARMGRVAGYFSVAGNRPNSSDITAFLDELSTEVDEAIRSKGFDPAALDANGKKALLDLVAYGAAARALRGMGDRSPEVLSVLVEADAVWTAGRGAITDGTSSLLAALEAGAAGGGPVVSSGSFWSDESNAGRPEYLQSEYVLLRGTTLAPAFTKGQHL